MSARRRLAWALLALALALTACGYEQWVTNMLF